MCPELLQVLVLYLFNTVRGTAIIPILQTKKLRLRARSEKTRNRGSLFSSEKNHAGKQLRMFI